MGAHDSLDNCQTQAASRELRREEWIEKFFLCFFRNAAAGIRNLQSHVIARS
jgi:hypothetical protein